MFYREDRPYYIELGKPAFVVPINHPDTVNVTGNGERTVITSPVRLVNIVTGEFWTENTHYAPIVP